ncbi:MAG: DUF1631 domain-containing protein [Proteobacteria bacterium]|nr:DUF1631 domain-containing protein [Pseudomonadota bacterium]
MINSSTIFYKSIHRVSIVLFLLFSFSTAIFTQILEPVKWKTEKIELENGEYELIFTANIDKGWNVYSQYTGDDGPVPTSIYYDSIKGAEILGEALEFGHKKEGPDPLFEGTNVIKYLADEPFVIKQKIKVTDKSQNELAHDLREDNARIIQQTPLFERALSSIAEQMQTDSKKTS